MSIVALKSPPEKAPKRSAKVISLPATSNPRLGVRRILSDLGARVLPPLVVLMVLLAVWQVAFSGEGSGLPTPAAVWAESADLILDPFYVYGTQDIGLGWRVLTSLERVAYGFGLAAVVGVLVGAMIGQSALMMRGFDPIFQVLRTVPPLAWLPISLAAFMDSRPSAIFVIFITAIWPIIINTAAGVRAIPQDYRNVAAVLRLNQIEFFWKIMVPSAAPYLFRPPHRRRPLVASHRSGRNADRRRRHRLLHLGCVEQQPVDRHHSGAGLHRGDRLRA